MRAEYKDDFHHSSQLVTSGPILSRRRFLGTTAVSVSTLGFSACGGGLVGPEEGEDVFTFDVKLLNAAAREQAVTILSGDRTFFNQVPFGTIATATLQEDFFVFLADLTIKGDSTGIEGIIPEVRVLPAICMLLSGSTDGKYSIIPIGGVPGEYSSEFWKTPFQEFATLLLRSVRWRYLLEIPQAEPLQDWGSSETNLIFL